jgi:hypothetical protein
LRHLQLRNENKYERDVCNVLFINCNNIFLNTQVQALLGAKHFTVSSICSSAYILHIVHLLLDDAVTFSVAAVVCALSSSSVFTLLHSPKKKKSKGGKIKRTERPHNWSYSCNPLAWEIHIETVTGTP